MLSSQNTSKVVYNYTMDYLNELKQTQNKLDQIEAARDVYLERRADFMIKARNNNVPVSVLAEVTNLSQVRIYQILQGR